MPNLHALLGDAEVIDLGDRVNHQRGRWIANHPRRVYELHEKVILPSLLYKNGMNVLEVGVGSGEHIHLYRNKRFTGLAVCDKSFKIASTHAAEYRLRGTPIVRGEPEDLPFEDASFSRVFAISTLYACRDINKALDEMHRVVRPAGTLTIGERLTVLGKSEIQCETLDHELKLLPEWYASHGYDCSVTEHQATFLGESLTEEPNFTFRIFTGVRKSKK